MKILYRALILLFLLLAVLMAVSNAGVVALTLWPLPFTVAAPLYLLIISVLLVGVLAGLAFGWWAGRHHRRRAREHGKGVARLEREVAHLREQLAGLRPHASASHEVRTPGQKAIDRQSALVAPDLMPSRRGPSPS
ncbi:Protein of unknown function [Enhydrobacter aerosaccus]|uniref:Lipopolysaccharide assembly protein A domain-containing protein n=1 Tax=Enhydrobacter aerosaccus TaxID=225324 RepID=A0A1T4R9L3_9HYPH|nr:LapA family protein [Enhydrobacter aerosaccus]SKA12712.1 Protein of unknown function [Enhydrobacter aerosaccus]